ncbi:hypothetical protein [Azospirillum canadense]|uniref:hypothetical protein n=1 Tax=Azospirillum canadense TaxID=403962 RepID=UPI002227B14F|nr:hypothetical protein [Azospirillum canadense]MCW2243844.1 hypothetical protein [Azospirillum canadense]
MRATIDRIKAGRLLPPDDLKRLGLNPWRVVRVALETVGDEEDISITEMNARGGGFNYLADEPNLYSDSDLVERYRL